MSLVFEALRRNNDTAHTQTAGGSVLTAGNSLRKNRLKVILTWLIVGLSMGGGYALLKPYLPALVLSGVQPVSSQTPERDPAALLPVEPAPASETALISRSEVVTPLNKDSLATLGKAVSQAATQVHQPLASTPKTAVPVSQSTASTTESAFLPEALVSPEPAPDVNPRYLLASFNGAMASGQTEQAEQLLADARHTLGTEHLMVLRMTGYYCLQNACDNRARQAYLTILSRLPEDKEAGYNLAVLDGRNGQLERAHERVNRLLQHYPGDSALRSLQNTLYKEGR